jgi:hypothetical protein
MDSDRFEQALNAFLSHALGLINDSYAYCGRENRLDVRRRSKRYIKIVLHSGLHEDAVYCFIDARNGDVLEANSWSSPHPKPRGNIFTPENYGVAWHGAHYLR